ncbi:MAG: hypothetical protein L0G22_08350 [Propionibacteriaceae bacterium]|nr:hypothetical protein [Propionibacteriaceae bacterium]
MSFRWVTDAKIDERDTGLGQCFPTRADAEAWLTASYEDLADAGVTEVTLMEDDHVLYGPMSLLA